MAKFTLTPEDDKRITESIRAAEKNTSGEIFCVLMRASSDYRMVPIAWAALTALFVPMPLLYFTRIEATAIYIFQLLAFLIVMLVLLLPAVRLFMIPKRTMHERAHAEAQRQFAAHGLHRTVARTGVLIFVSLAERYVEVVADVGIAAKVEQAVWDRVVKVLTQAMKKEKIADGYVDAIGICGEVLAQHFPPGAINRDELPDKLILL
jgi:putative membrane protein